MSDLPPENSPEVKRALQQLEAQIHELANTLDRVNASTLPDSDKTLLAKLLERERVRLNSAFIQLWYHGM